MEVRKEEKISCWIGSHSSFFMVDDDDDIISAILLFYTNSTCWSLRNCAKTEMFTHLLDMLVINQQIVDEILHGATFHQFYIVSHRKTWH